jgi:hypothetical protein
VHVVEEAAAVELHEHAAYRVPQNAPVRILSTLAAAALLAVAPGCGASEPDQQPVEFLEQVFGHLYRGEHAAAWDMLYPAHQEVVSRAAYAACERNAPSFAGELELVEVLSEKEEDWHVAGDDEPRGSRAVTYRVTVRIGGAPERFTADGHLVAVDGAWRWILKPSDFEAYRAGRCPVTQAPTQTDA